MYKLFQNNIKQLNIGDVQGTLYNTFNCDLTYNKGKLSIAPRTRITTDSPTDFDTPVGFVYFDGFWWTVAGSFVWKSTNPQGAFVKDASTGGTYNPPTDCSSAISDICVFNDHLIVSTQTSIYRKAANGSGTGFWDKIDGITPLSNNVIRPLTVTGITSLQRLYWTRRPFEIVSCDTSFAISDTSSSAYNMTLPETYSITFLKKHSVGLYIGITMTDGTEGFVWDWNGETKDTYRATHNIYAQGALSAYVDNTVLYVMNSDAILLQFNGGKFIEVSRLPVKRNALFNSNIAGASSTGNDKFIHPNGMTMIDNNLSLLINATNSDGSGTQDENIHSGIWEFLPDSNTLYHKYSFSYNTIGGTQTDSGQIRIKSAGGLTNVPDFSSYSNAQKGNFLAGASFYSDATTVRHGVFTDNYYDNEQKAGFFSTVQLRAENYEDMWQRITTLYTPSDDLSFVWKYRKKKTDHIDFTITWTSTTTFTTTQVGIVEGDEITIIQGKGSGRIAHVVGTPTFSSPNYTVTLDEAIINVTGTAKARLQKWKKIGIINNINRFYQEVVIGNPSTLIELKCAMVATGEATIDELILDNKLNK